jgi:hypothetical protein
LRQSDERAALPEERKLEESWLGARRIQSVGLSPLVGGKFIHVSGFRQNTTESFRLTRKLAEARRRETAGKNQEDRKWKAGKCQKENPAFARINVRRVSGFRRTQKKAFDTKES